MKKQWKKLSRKCEDLLTIFKAEVDSHKVLYGFLFVVLFLALLVRVYKTGTTLGFYFDQGRDAMEIWELWHNHDIFLIGPTTGIAGIFRGPYYYYLIAPIYLLSGGDPVWPANFLAATSVLAIAVMYYLGFRIKDRLTGIFAAIIASFSFYIMLSSRWLSNPTPMLLLSMLFVWSLFLVSEGKKMAWIAVAFLSGLSLFHFGSSGEFFYFPAILLFAIWQKKYFPNAKIIFYSILAFGLTILPLVLFDFKNDHLLSKNIYNFIFEKESFKTGFFQVLNERLDFYKVAFIDRIFPSTGRLTTTLLVFVSVSFLYYLPQMLKNTKAKIIMLILLSPVIGLLFFQGNEGNIYDYYMTGYFLIFILFFAMILGHMWKTIAGKMVVITFFVAFLNSNIPIVSAKIRDNADGPHTILFRNQKQAIEYIYSDAAGTRFNVDVYVPPVIPHAYNYLFTWYESMPEYNGNSSEQLPLLYTLYEEDPPHPERLEAWLARQKGIGEVEYSKSFGGITVERRKRVK